MQGTRRTVGGAALLVAILAPSSAVGGPDGVRVTVAKQKDGPYGSESPQVQVRNRAKSFYMRARNETTGIEDIALEDISNDPGNDFRIRWFRGSQEVTEAARGAGYGFQLDADEAQRFQVRVKPRVPNPGELCLTGRFDVASQPDDDPVGSFYVNSTNICG